jgi:hypothetical protein
LHCVALRLTFIFRFAFIVVDRFLQLPSYQPKFENGRRDLLSFRLTTAFDAHLGWDFPCFYHVEATVATFQIWGKKSIP